jgi:hypothetical protein
VLVSHIVFPLVSETEVDELEVKAFFIEEKEVLGFQVSMRDVVGMAVVNCLHYLDEDLAGIVF